MRGWIVAGVMLGVMGTAGAASPERRVALVIGNSAYQQMQSLGSASASTDADAMADLLKKVGFDVVKANDLTRDKMKGRLAEFGKKADGADIALLYYAGQNVTVSGINYLVPVGANLKSDADAKSGAAVSLEDAVDQTMTHAKIKLVFLDASRIDPFPGGNEKAPPTATGADSKTREGMVMAFATGPGQTALGGEKGGHSPFTKALLDNIGAPGIEIQQAMTRVRAEVVESTDKKQLPWGSSYLASEVYLNPKPADAAAPAKK
jgi:uncharacterized caspase-like protein